jgi:hypothetical protein
MGAAICLLVAGQSSEGRGAAILAGLTAFALGAWAEKRILRAKGAMTGRPLFPPKPPGNQNSYQWRDAWELSTLTTLKEKK